MDNLKKQQEERDLDEDDEGIDQDKEFFDEEQEVDEQDHFNTLMADMFKGKLSKIQESSMRLSQMQNTQVMEKVKDAVKKDPFLKYGAGIQNYFNLQVSLIKLFSFLSVIAIV